jgi:N-acetylglucosaminyl-diphospho-decaprenol L-rhamnosyltransferase
MTTPLLTLSIVSHGSAATIQTLLNSLQQHEADPQRFRILLTDNLRNDLPEFDPTPWHSLHILRNQNQLGFAHNHNNAFQHAQGEWFAVINPYLVFERPIFDSLIQRLTGQPDSLLAPYIMDEHGHMQDSFRPLPTPFELLRRRLPGYHFQPLPPGPDGFIRPDWVAGMFWLLKADVYRKLGGMDAGYRLYFEDVDFCTRARLQGIQVLVDSQVRIRHDARRDSRRKLFYMYLHTRSALRFFASPVYRQARRI